jgi:hypothetical protein
MGVFDIFRSGATSAAQNSPTLSSQNFDMNNPQARMNPADPANTPPLQTTQGQPTLTPEQIAAEAERLKSLNDPYAELWNIDPKTNPQPADLAEFSFNMDPVKVNQQIGAMDFTKAITPEILQKIAAGGADAVTAMITAMNTVGQEAVKAALTTSVKVTETGIRNTGQRMKDQLPGLVRNETVSGVLREDNPLFNDPSTAPMMELVTQQMAMKFPQASPQEIKKHAMSYMANFATNAAKFTGKLISDAPAPNPQGARTVQVDWSTEPT